MPTFSSPPISPRKASKVYKVRFYKRKNGKSPIDEFIISAYKSLKTKIARQVEYLEEFGLTFANPSLKKLTGTPFWEVRILGKDSARIICVAVVNKEIIVVHIFKKKGNKIPLKDIKIALKRYKEELDK